MKTVGIMGGLGPLAGAHFYKRVIELSPAQGDEEHLPVILMSDPRIPSRLRHLQGAGESPVFKLREIAEKLVAMGAERIALPSSTTNVYYEDIVAASQVPVISLVREVASTVSRGESRRVGILATTPTRTYEVYTQAFQAEGIELVYPDDRSQEEIMDVIGEVKGGPSSDTFARFSRTHYDHMAERIHDIARRPWSKSTDSLLLACTEIPVIFPVDQWAGTSPVYSSTDILAAAVVREAYS